MRDVHERAMSLFMSPRDSQSMHLSRPKMTGIGMSGVVVQSLFKPPNEKFLLPTLGHGRLHHIVIGDLNSHNTTWGYTATGDNGETVEQ